MTNGEVIAGAAAAETNLRLPGLQALAEQVLVEKPEYVIFGDAHITAEHQNITAAFLETLAADPRYRHGGAGLYVEALYDTARPAEGDFSGGVVRYDQPNFGGRTKYLAAMQTAIRLGIAVHGIDLQKDVDQESLERMLHWKGAIESGTEQTKVLLVGAGHLWNDAGKPADLMYLLGKTQLVASNERAYNPPGFSERMPLEVARPDITDRQYVVAKYQLP